MSVLGMSRLPLPEAKIIIVKLVIAASAYFLWQERNWRLFKKSKRTTSHLVDMRHLEKSLEKLEPLGLWSSGKLSSFEANPDDNVTGAPVTNTVVNHAEKPENFNCYGCMETFGLLVSQLCSEWYGGLFVQRVLQDHDCQRIMGVIGTQLRMERTILGNFPTANIKGKGDGEYSSTAIVIMEALEEFKFASGLTHSLPKSTTYFCNVLNHIKISILHILPFEEGRLPVKYLGVPFVLSRLMVRDCKELIEKVQIRVQDWKNKSLSIAGRLQLIISVTGSMHIYWASVFMLPSHVLLDIEQKFLQLLPVIREFIWYKLRDGANTSIWYDRWCENCQLSNQITTRDMFRTGLNLSSKVKDIVQDGAAKELVVALAEEDVVKFTNVVKEFDDVEMGLLAHTYANKHYRGFSVASLSKESQERGFTDYIHPSHATAHAVLLRVQRLKISLLYQDATLSSRISRSRIDVISNVEGTLFENDKVPEAFVSYYEMFLGLAGKTHGFNTLNLFKTCLNEHVALDMVREEQLETVALIPKIIANRIKHSLKELISPNQSAFVPGRSITDNILLTQELMHNYHLDRGTPRCAFKVDIQKAYDTVDWKFLKEILHGFGFHACMISWIIECLHLLHIPYVSMGLFMVTFKLELINLCFADDLFLFAYGDIQSAIVIMEALEEFKFASGLTHSLPKSTTYFCNVLNHIKISILHILPFEEGLLPVKYLGVPFVLSRLMKGKAKVAWEVACLPKDDGGLGIRRLEHFNSALMVSHVWKLLSLKESLWVKWIHVYKHNWRSFWDVPIRGNLSWGWRKILQLLPVIREFIWYKLRDGANTYDRWCENCPLSNQITTRDMFRTRLNLSSKVKDIVQDGAWVWPPNLLAKYTFLSSCSVSVVEGSLDNLEWRAYGVSKTFSVSQAFDLSLEKTESFLEIESLKEFGNNLDGFFATYVRDPLKLGMCLNCRLEFTMRLILDLVVALAEEDVVKFTNVVKEFDGVEMGLLAHTYANKRYRGFSVASLSKYVNNITVSGNGGGWYSRPLPNGQCVCKFYKNGRCKRRLPATIVIMEAPAGS
ncbi:probable kinetochore protein NUF2 [Tanacetum coccineum]|uniref:Probable kinetochore protein NUF2 n=1 Tax=Tanacetum coccineum TaxID=301880 RepID=A0ABQ5EVB2_9ASTR